jgi:hypothetical protein
MVVARGCGDGEGVAGVVVEPVQNFDVGALGQPPVGEVGLPAFIGLFGGKADEGGLGSALGCGGDEAGGGQLAADARRRHHQPVVELQVPGDGVGTVVESFAGQLPAQADDQIDGGLRQSGRAAVRPA